MTNTGSSADSASSAPTPPELCTKDVSTSTRPFRFLDLPSELQSQVYRHLIDDKVSSIGRFNYDHDRWEIISNSHAIREADVEIAINSITFCPGLRARALEEWFGYIDYVGLVTCKAHSVRGRDSYRIPEVHTSFIESDVFRSHGEHLILSAVISIDSLDIAFMFMMRVAETCTELVTLGISISPPGQTSKSWTAAEQEKIAVRFVAMKKGLLWQSKLGGLPDSFTVTLLRY
ncbi:hypothetical protein LTR95_000615 [Oleoguttula sp. CCFEE 5521]